MIVGFESVDKNSSIFGDDGDNPKREYNWFSEGVSNIDRWGQNVKNKKYEMPNESKAKVVKNLQRRWLLEEEESQCHWLMRAHAVSLFL